MANKPSGKAKLFPQDQKQRFVFSDTILENFQESKYPVAEETVFKDSYFGSNGLRIRAYPSGKASYFVEKRIRSAKGGAKKRRICDVGELTVAQARTKAGKFIAWMAEGLDPYTELEKEKELNKVYTLRDAYDLYMIDRNIADLTIERYERVKDVISYVHINKKMSWKDITSHSQIINTNIFKGNTSNLISLLDADLNDIRSQTISHIHKSITISHGHGEQYAKSEGDRAIKFIDSLYAKAIPLINERHDDNNFIKRNPTKLMAKEDWNNPGGKSIRRNECLDSNDIKAHYEAIESLKTLKNAADETNKQLKYTKIPIPGAVRAHYFFKFMFWTGWRPNDVSKIQWDQVEIENGITTVSWNDAKAVKRLKSNKKIYKAPLNHKAASVLDELRKLKKEKMKAVANGDLVLRKDYDDKHIFLNVLENGHIKANQHSYEAIVSSLSDTRHYPTGIYRKTFLTYGNSLDINIYTLKRLVFHTQNYFDVTSGYIFTGKDIFIKATEKICEYLLSFVEPSKFKYEKKSDKQVEIKLDEDIFNEMKAQFGDDSKNKYNDFIRMALAVKHSYPHIFNQLNSTTIENAKFEDSDFDD